jgi:hypothetical protein
MYEASQLITSVKGKALRAALGGADTVGGFLPPTPPLLTRLCPGPKPAGITISSAFILMGGTQERCYYTRSCKTALAREAQPHHRT